MEAMAKWSALLLLIREAKGWIFDLKSILSTEAFHGFPHSPQVHLVQSVQT